MKRKDFLQQTAIIGAGALCIPSLFTACATYKPKYLVDGNTLKISKNEFIDSTTTPASRRLFISVKLDKYPFPIGISQNANGSYTAVYLECTHRGCGLQNTGEQLQCPCHGSEFSYSGKVMSAPADKDLKIFPLEEKGEELWISLT